jgi:hypothetical protein
MNFRRMRRIIRFGSSAVYSLGEEEADSRVLGGFHIK